MSSRESSFGFLGLGAVGMAICWRLPVLGPIGVLGAIAGLSVRSPIVQTALAESDARQVALLALSDQAGRGTNMITPTPARHTAAPIRS